MLIYSKNYFALMNIAELHEYVTCLFQSSHYSHDFNLVALSLYYIIHYKCVPEAVMLCHLDVNRGGWLKRFIPK